VDDAERVQLDAEPAWDKLAAYITAQKLQASPRVQNLSRTAAGVPATATLHCAIDI